MEKTYKGFKGEEIIDDEGKELIVLEGDDLENMVWIEVVVDEIRATDLEVLQKFMKENKISNLKIKDEAFTPGLRHFIVDIKNL
jgi:hypothetical protein